MDIFDLEKFTIFDGAMGTMMQNAGILKAGALPETLNITAPEEIIKIHSAYAAVGCEVASTNTFGANAYKLKGCGYSVAEIIHAAVSNAKKSGCKYTALDIGPIGQLLAPLGTLSFDDAYEMFKEQVTAGTEAGADIILFETFSDLTELKAAVLAAKENSDLPVIASMTYTDNGRTFVGVDPVCAAVTLSGLGVSAVGVNCSLAPAELTEVVKKVSEYSSVPVLVQANAGLPHDDGGKVSYDVDSDEYLKGVKELVAAGASMIGGCCGTTPEYMAKISAMLKGQAPTPPIKRRLSAACSPTHFKILDNSVTVIGERINPTGKKKLKEALKEHKMDYIIGEAIDQTSCGADILDINVGLPEIDEVNMMKEVVAAVTSVSPLPLQIDSSNPSAIEAGARYFGGVPVINSVNGKQAEMDRIFPIAKKYGALIVGLTLDEDGIPETAEKRCEIAEKIVREAEKYGIGREKIIIDCLTLTVSAQQEQALATLEAIKMVKARLGVKTVLGVSNISFGLPNRPLFNSMFLSAAFGAGLDAAIINPMSKEVMTAVDVFKVCGGEDKAAAHYIEKYADAASAAVEKTGIRKDLYSCIIEGREEEAANAAEELLKTQSAAQIVDENFIPALNFVGDKFEKGTLFLPQLMQSASAVKAAFETIRAHNEKSGVKTETRGTVILATVKGDIHDIGKNIVKMMLENYGYNVVDLGRDVDPQRVVEAVKDTNAPLVGLSALMTTTVVSIRDTVDALKSAGMTCKVMAGGAVLTEEYAKSAGADFYAKDAQQSVRIANEIFGF